MRKLHFTRSRCACSVEAQSLHGVRKKEKNKLYSCYFVPMNAKYIVLLCRGFSFGITREQKKAVCKLFAHLTSPQLLPALFILLMSMSTLALRSMSMTELASCSLISFSKITSSGNRTRRFPGFCRAKTLARRLIWTHSTGQSEAEALVSLGRFALTHTRRERETPVRPSHGTLAVSLSGCVSVQLRPHLGFKSSPWPFSLSLLFLLVTMDVLCALLLRCLRYRQQQQQQSSLCSYHANEQVVLADKR